MRNGLNSAKYGKEKQIFQCRRHIGAYTVDNHKNILKMLSEAV